MKGVMKVESAKTWIRRSRKREVKDHGYNFNLDDKKKGKTEKSTFQRRNNGFCFKAIASH